VLFHPQTLESLFFVITMVVALFSGVRSEPASDSAVVHVIGLIRPIRREEKLERKEKTTASMRECRSMKMSCLSLPWSGSDGSR
jgi:hypothetical protein